MINELSKQIHQNAKDKGFYDNPRNIGEMLCLIHSEVSEALECDRAGNYSNRAPVGLQNMLKDGDKEFFDKFTALVKDTFQDELADIMIRVMDLAEHKGVDLENHILLKMRYNSMRPHKHGKLY